MNLFLRPIDGNYRSANIAEEMELYHSIANFQIGKFCPQTV